MTFNLKKIYKDKIFKNYNVVVTGSEGKLGKKIVDLYRLFDANLILIDKVDASKKYNNKKNINYFKCNFENIKDIKILIDSINKKFKKINILINNAAYTGSDTSWIKPFGKQKIEDWNKVFKVNLDISFQISQGLSKKLIKSNGSIINIGSTFATNIPNMKNYKGTKMGSPAAYSVSKNGLMHLTKWLSVNFAPKVNVNMISPGGIERNQNKKFKKKYIYSIPMNRMCNEEDLFGIIMLLSNKHLSKYITGQNIIVDGGNSAL